MAAGKDCEENHKEISLSFEDVFSLRSNFIKQKRGGRRLCGDLTDARDSFMFFSFYVLQD